MPERIAVGFILLHANDWEKPLFTIRLVHTHLWALMAACILALPVLALRRRFRWGARTITLRTAMAKPCC